LIGSADLEKVGFLSAFTEDDREALAELLEEKTLAAGRRAFSEGSEAEEVVFVISGSLRLKSRRAGDLGCIGAGQTLGGLCLVAVGLREATAMAEEPTRIAVLPRSAFPRLADDAPRTACRLLEAVGAEAGSLLRMTLDQVAGPAREIE